MHSTLGRLWVVGLIALAFSRADAPTLDIVAQRAYLKTAAGGGGVEVASPAPGQTVYFTVDFQITGTGGPVMFFVRALLDGVQFCGGSVTYAPGPQTTGCPNGWVATAGSHTLEWDLDYTNLVPETNENNNSVTTMFGLGTPDLTIAKTHTGNFTQGQVGATYTITVGNIGVGPSSGPVAVIDTLPPDLTATGIAGAGWNCIQPSGPCTRFDPLAEGSSYPDLTLTVSVSNTATGVITNTATVSGGGEININNDLATDPTTIGINQTPGNIALHKAATQSSTLFGYLTAGAAAAVDGNTDGIFSDGSVTATNPELNAWWQVDLGVSTAIGSIVIWNRTDCCGSRLNDYWVFVSDTPFAPTDSPATLQNRYATWSSHQTTVPNPSIAIPAGAQGRYVRVQLTGTDYLSLAEVQVFPGVLKVSNLALNKPATQSSTLAGYPTASAASAVDGNQDGNFFNGSVTHTNLETNAWWQVDLGGSTTVNSIAIWNRTDCCGSRLADYWIFVSDTPFAAADTPFTLQNRPGVWSSHQTTAPSPSATIPAGAHGRYVRVQITSANYLSLAEVQVMGQ
jgi:uncharacterized repeat protein (TIGR01451 family)